MDYQSIIFRKTFPLQEQSRVVILHQIHPHLLEYEEIIDTLREMNLHRPGEKLGYNPTFTRTDLTDDLHAVCGFRTDYEIISDINMKKVIRVSKKK